MKKSILNLLLLFGSVLLFNGCNLFNKEVDEDNEEFLFAPFEDDFKIEKTATGTEAFIASIALKGEDMICPRPPSLQEVNTGAMYYTEKLYSLRQAYNLGIPLVSSDYTKNYKVYVRDYTRYKLCETEDGLNSIKYGQVIRTVVEVGDYDASLGVSLASIAANGTINNRSQSFRFYKDGIANPKIDQIIAEVSGTSFNVENFDAYNKIMSRIIGILGEPETIWSVNPIGVEEKMGDDAFLKEAPIIAYTISSIQKGKNCTEIKSKFGTNSNALELVERTFQAMELDCQTSDITEEKKLEAKRLLQGIKVK